MFSTQEGETQERDGEHHEEYLSDAAGQGSSHSDLQSRWLLAEKFLQPYGVQPKRPVQ